ncbi:hypothetical protein LGN09_06380 [Burkholderia cenocepacia]|uniref:hypothetical protein n=1 Tax=Burkholderia cenocepacia TaxID=95486 RepID=UPI001CF227C1|nr:hypothetical protein [Burkholderia cenocepacia]MCA8404509.1 hypothetical protein [Burkholderia cenocepacia]
MGQSQRTAPLFRVPGDAPASDPATVKPVISRTDPRRDKARRQTPNLCAGEASHDADMSRHPDVLIVSRVRSMYFTATTRCRIVPCRIVGVPN